MIPSKIQIAVALCCLGNSDKDEKSTSVQYRHKYCPSILGSLLIKAPDAGSEGSEGLLCFSSRAEVAAARRSEGCLQSRGQPVQCPRLPVDKAKTLEDM